MSSFPALGFDPAPGTVTSADGVAQQVRTSAASIREAADVLAGTGQQNWQGETATAFHETMGRELTPRVVTAADSFETAAAALETWASSLLGFQQRAAELESRAATALSAVSAAADELSVAQQSEDPGVDSAGASGRLSAATGELESIRSEAYALADSYAAEAEYVASCMADAADAAPDQSRWDSFFGWAGDVVDGFIDYVLPALEDILTIVAIGLAVVAVVALIATPMGWAGLAAAAATIGKAAFWVSAAGVAVDGLQFASGREDGTEFAVGLVGLGVGALTGPLVNGIKGVAAYGGGWGGMVPAMAGRYGGSGGTALVGALGMHWHGAGAVASGVYVANKLYSDTKKTRDTMRSVQGAGGPFGRTWERFRSLIDGDGFTTAQQRQDIAARQDAEC